MKIKYIVIVASFFALLVSAPVFAEQQVYKVKKGDSLYRIGKNFNTTPKALMELNGLKSDKINIGQVLKIPVKNNTSSVTQTANAVKAEPVTVTIQPDKIPLSAPISLSPAAQAVNQKEYMPIVNPEELTVRDRLVDAGFNLLGVRYRYGGTSEKTGLDCSALVKNIFEKIGLTLPRTSREQYTRGEKVAKEDLQKGDLIFFSSGGKTPTHVGVYVGNNQFLHAASKAKKVIVSDLGKTWYDLRYLGARRIMELWWEDNRIPAVETQQVPVTISTAVPGNETSPLPVSVPADETPREAIAAYAVTE